MDNEEPVKRQMMLEKIVNKLYELNVPLDVDFFNILLTIYVENNHSLSPKDFLNTMEKKGITPDR